ncbi:MAG: hypothetical protein EOM80_10905 [Erysipelotrichia bacterium]|nr:hypothetical protein [Erysipelotrichia bacterium]
MEERVQIIIVLCFVVVFILTVLYTVYLAKKRREAFALLASKMGFSYTEEDQGFCGRFKHLKIFSRGHSQRAFNVLVGEKNNIKVEIADYYYTTGSGKNKSVTQQTVCVITDPELSLPHFFLRRELSILDFLGKMFGGQDINFPEDNAFSGAFVLQGIVENETRELFNKDIRGAFMRFAATNSQAEGLGHFLVFHRSVTLEPEQIPGLLKDTFDIYHAFKNDLHNEF